MTSERAAVEVVANNRGFVAGYGVEAGGFVQEKVLGQTKPVRVGVRSCEPDL